MLTTPDPARGEADHILPEFLPDGQNLLFTITKASGGLDAAEIALLNLQTGKQTMLLRGGSHARYLPTGHLVYGAGGTLHAVAFDLSRLAVVGNSVPVLSSVAMNAAGVVEAAVSDNGTLAYLSGSTFAALGQRTLVWADRQGHEEPIDAPPRAYQQPRLSPDGTRVALASTDQEQDLQVWDLARKTLTQLTFDPALDQAPLWMRTASGSSSAQPAPAQRVSTSSRPMAPGPSRGCPTALIRSLRPASRPTARASSSSKRRLPRRATCGC